MAITEFFNEARVGGKNVITFTREQASRFAKDVADDFNPLHDIDAKRFCVPGDLLFALVLSKFGISQQMRFAFSGMVTDGVRLVLPEATSHIEINGENNKNYLNVEHSGDNSKDTMLVENLIRSYVTFSGHAFPHILIPLMREHRVMIHPRRPMVMYERMLIDLQQLNLTDIHLELDTGGTHLDVKGKRGSACLAFNLKAEGKTIGRGEKHMLLSGLQPFQQSLIDHIITEYNHRKHDYKSKQPLNL